MQFLGWSDYAGRDTGYFGSDVKTTVLMILSGPLVTVAPMIKHLHRLSMPSGMSQGTLGRGSIHQGEHRPKSTHHPKADHAGAGSAGRILGPLFPWAKATEATTAVRIARAMLFTSLPLAPPDPTRFSVSWQVRIQACHQPAGVRL